MEFGTGFLNHMMTGEGHALKCLNVIWPSEIFTSLAFGVDEASLEPLLKALEQSMIVRQFK